MMNFFNDKSIFLTGHTGFKGAWLCQLLKRIGARVTGYALAPERGGLFEAIDGSDGINSEIGDIRDYDRLSRVFRAAQPEIVLHLAAQPLVLDSYERPAHTFETNLMGTVNLLECVRRSGNSVHSVVMVTTDKVYSNIEHTRGYLETDALGGADPYSSSKACSELAAASYAQSFLKPARIPLSTLRAGNVIGGGDIAQNRIIPDCVRAAAAGKTIGIRNPYSVRPYQHVLEPLCAYLLVAKRQWADPTLAGGYNVGPDRRDTLTTGDLATIFCEQWGNGQSWDNVSSPDAPREAGLLYLDCSKIRSILGWRPVWDIATAVHKTVTWEKARYCSGDVSLITNQQIDEYLGVLS